MSKISIIEEYICKCEECIQNNDKENAKILENTILGVFTKDISSIKVGLDRYKTRVITPGSVVHYDYLGDIAILKAKLLAYKAELEDVEPVQKAPFINISNVNDNINNVNSLMNLQFDDLLKVIDKIPDTELSGDEKELLEDKISAVELQLKKNDKNKAKEKLVGVLKFIADKGIDVGIAMLPYMGKIATEIQKLF